MCISFIWHIGIQWDVSVPLIWRKRQLIAGHDPKGYHIYPGDSEIKFEDAICIQLHKVRLKCADYKWNGKAAYTLAIYYPEDFAVSYVEPRNSVKKYE